MVLVEDIKVPIRVREPFTDAEREKLLRECRTLRDKAMMEFLYSTAVRVGELVKLNRGDIRFSTKDLVVCGKGDKERLVYMNERTHMYLLEYLESRTDTNPALFVSLRSPHERLTDKGVEDIVRRTGRRVGVKAYPHKFRGTSITNALNRGMAITGSILYGRSCQIRHNIKVCSTGSGFSEVPSQEIFKCITYKKINEERRLPFNLRVVNTSG